MSIWRRIIGGLMPPRSGYSPSGDAVPGAPIREFLAADDACHGTGIRGLLEHVGVDTSRGITVDGREVAPPILCPECSEPYRSVPGGRSCTHARDCRYPFRDRTPDIEPGEGSPGDIGLGPLPSFSAPPTLPPYHYGDNGNGISGRHTGRVEDCPGPGCGPADCEATATTADMTFGPCIKREAPRAGTRTPTGRRGRSGRTGTGKSGASSLTAGTPTTAASRTRAAWTRTGCCRTSRSSRSPRTSSAAS